MTSDVTKLPRLYIDRTLAPNATFMLETAQAHYVKNVMRMKPGDFVRFFNGRDGEWLATITTLDRSNTTITLKGKTRDQTAPSAQTHLLFAPLKKDRLDFIIEKSVELGVTDLHPVLTNRTEVRKINEERLQSQIQEAAEQCERLDLPTLHPLKEIRRALKEWRHDFPVLWGSERGQSPHINTFKEKSWAFLIGPVGGFDDSEFAFLMDFDTVKPMSLGETVLRSETAAIMALSYAKIISEK